MRGEYETREIRNFAFLYKFREFVLIFIFGRNTRNGKSDRTSESKQERERPEALFSLINV